MEYSIKCTLFPRAYDMVMVQYHNGSIDHTQQIKPFKGQVQKEKNCYQFYGANSRMLH